MITALTKYKQYIKELLLLSYPLFVGNLGHTLIGITDVFVISKYNIKSLAAVGIANSIFFTMLIFGIGIIVAVSIILSNLRGKKQGIKKYLLSTIVMSIIVSCIFTIIYYLSIFFMPKMHFETDLIPYIQEYMKIVSFSMFGIFIFEGIKQFLQAYEIVKFPNFILLGAVILNFILDLILVFGFGSIPSMGSKGAAIATLSVRSIMGIILFLYILKFINIKFEIYFSYMKNILKTGLPIGLALFFETMAFNIITVFAGMEGSILAAVHSILITIANTTFMIPLAISTALSVKVSYWYGAKKPLEIKNYSYTAIFMILSVMILISLILALFPGLIISIFTTESEVMKIAVPLISIVAAYQIFDGLQAATGGVLKGFKLTKTVSLTVLAGYWIFGAPIAYVLVTKFGMSLRGYWIALAIALFTMGFMQAFIAKRYYKSIK